MGIAGAISAEKMCRSTNKAVLLLMVSTGGALMGALRDGRACVVGRSTALPRHGKRCAWLPVNETEMRAGRGIDRPHHHVAW